jgi:hypothetical protein
MTEARPEVDMHRPLDQLADAMYRSISISVSFFMVAVRSDEYVSPRQTMSPFLCVGIRELV